jgi:O-antigen ligase
VEWSLVYIAFLAYIVVIISYKFRVGDIAVGAALLGTVLQKHRVRFSPILAWLGLLLAISALGFAQTDYPDAVWSATTDLVKLWLICFAGVNALRTRAQIRLFMIVVVGVFALFPARGTLFNYVLYSSSIFGRASWNYIYENPNDLAALTLLALSVAASILVGERKGWIKTGAFAAVFVLPIVILMTQSRGGVLALAAGLGLAAITQGHGRRSRGVGGIVILATIAALVAPSGVWSRLRGLSKVTSAETLREADTMGSAEARFGIWQVAFTIVAHHPIIGVGLGAYTHAHDDYSSGLDVVASAKGSKDTHSTYLNVAAETGVLGFLSFALVLIAAVRPAERVRKLYREEHPAAAAQVLYLELGLLAFLVAGFFGSFAKLSFLYIHLVLIWSLAEVLSTEFAKTAPPGSSRAEPRSVL